jgi:hypothetical protein
LQGLRPGDNLPETTYLARYNNAHMPVQTEGDYQKRRNRKKVHRGKPVPWFEKYGPGGIRAVHRGMERGDLRAPPSPPVSVKAGGTVAEETPSFTEFGDRCTSGGRRYSPPEGTPVGVSCGGRSAS